MPRRKNPAGAPKIITPDIRQQIETRLTELLNGSLGGDYGLLAKCCALALADELGIGQRNTYTSNDLTKAWEAGYDDGVRAAKGFTY